MKSRKPRRYGIARLALSFVVALLIIDALGALGYGTTTGSCCFVQEPGDPGSGNPGGGGPAPTPTPISYTWVEDLPLPSHMKNTTYNALFGVCERGESGAPGACFGFTYNYWDEGDAPGYQIDDPCCYGAYIDELSWQAVVTNGDANPKPYWPEIDVNGTLFNSHTSVILAEVDPQGGCHIALMMPSYPVEGGGCTNVGPYIIDGANEVDHVTVFGDPDVFIPVKGNTKDIDHKFY